jgi:malonate transporter
MSSLPVIITALVPSAFVILLGFIAGRIPLFKPESGGVLANPGFTFCLPSLLLKATAAMATAELHDWRFFPGLTLGLPVIYFLALTIALAVFRKLIAASSLQALSSAFPAMAGIPALLALIGASGVAVRCIRELNCEPRDDAADPDTAGGRSHSRGALTTHGDLESPPALH